MTPNIRKIANESSCIKLVRALIKEVLLSEDKKPGGGITDLGAGMVVNRKKTVKDIKNALQSAPSKGRVNSAANYLGVSPSTIYHYTSSNPADHAPSELKGYNNFLSAKEDREDNSADNNDDSGDSGSGDGDGQH